MSEETCDYDQYAKTVSTRHRLPLFTKTLEECGKYLTPDIPSNQWSSYSSFLPNSGGLVCVPYCDTAGKPSPTCSSRALGLDEGNNEWAVNGQQTGYYNYMGTYEDPGGAKHLDRCVLFDTGAKKCETIDLACCGRGFGGSDGKNCDRLDQNKLFLMTCHDEGNRGECCDHGTCRGGVCICDTGYAGNCCNCAPGYVKDTSGNCVIPDVNCCDLNTGEVSVVPTAQCQANVNQKPVDSADQCWLSNGDQSWCVAASAECTAVNSLGIWNSVKGEPGGKLAANCDACFPQGKYWCDANYTCHPITTPQEYQEHEAAGDVLDDCSTCFPINASWCSADGTQCKKIGNRADWELHDGDPKWRTAEANCNACYPGDASWCSADSVQCEDIYDRPSWLEHSGDPNWRRGAVNCADCFPKDKSWCSADSEQCGPITDRADWVLHDGDPNWRTAKEDCADCYPAGQFWCDGSKSCPAQTVEPYKKDEKNQGSNASENKALLWWSISGALAVVILLVCIFLLFRKNRT